jgi:hypothetical protein
MPWYFYQRSCGLSVPALASRLQEAHAEGYRWHGSQAADISRCVYATCWVCHRYIRNRRALAHGRFAIVEPLK